MSRYKSPVTYTVELVLPEGPNVVWSFYAGDDGKDESQKLFDQLSQNRGVMRSIQAPEDDDDGRYTIGVNRVVWDRNPDQDDAVGIILNQEGWLVQ